MKTPLFALTVTLSALAWPIWAKTADPVYHIVGTNRLISAKSTPEVTSLKSVSGLVLNGAVADGQWMMVSGQPETITGFINGQPISLKKGPPSTNKKPALDADAIKQRIATLKEKIAQIDAEDTKDATLSAPSMPVWEIKTGEKIEVALARWAATTPWRLIWEGPDIASRVDVYLDGPFEEAVQEVVTALNRSGRSIRAYFYRKNRVLRVTGGH